MMSNSNVIPLQPARSEQHAEEKFIGLLEADMEQNADSVVPLPTDLLDDIAQLCLQAEEAEATDLWEC